MGRDDFRNKHAKSHPRKEGTREPKNDSFLIVTEGTRTEPLYLEGLKKHINKNDLDCVAIKPSIYIKGEGKSPVKLVELAIREESKASKLYNQIWVVFDKDDYADFDKAVSLAKERGYEVACSNPSFEYWLYLHFAYADLAQHRDDWKKKLDEIFKKKGINKAGYTKTDPKIFDYVTTYGSLKDAIANAKKVRKDFNDDAEALRHNPCTTVYKLVEALEPYIKDMLA